MRTILAALLLLVGGETGLLAQPLPVPQVTVPAAPYAVGQPAVVNTILCDTPEQAHLIIQAAKDTNDFTQAVLLYDDMSFQLNAVGEGICGLDAWGGIVTAVTYDGVMPFLNGRKLHAWLVTIRSNRLTLGIGTMIITRNLDGSIPNVPEDELPSPTEKEPTRDA